MNDISLRDYFAAHAPAEPWPQFNPILPAGPIRPPFEPVGNEGESPTDEERQTLAAWRQDQDADIEEELPHFRFWILAWRVYAKALQKHSIRCAIERNSQWPWYYADAILSRREAPPPCTAA